MIFKIKPTPDKLKELVLHITEMSEKDARFMSTKLNKLVWASDFAAFCETGRTITGATYQKEKYGPVPRAMPIVLAQLQSEERLELQPVQVGAMPGKRPVAKGQADLSAFSQRDIFTVSKIVAENFGKTGTNMSEETHKFLAWQLADTGETIPFAAWLVSKRKPTDEERRVGLDLEAELHGVPS